MRSHITAIGSGGMDEHRYFAEEALGCKLPRGAEVHHVDGNGRNNDNSNLVICPDKAYHKLLHRRTKALQASGNPNFRQCVHCKKWDAPELLYVYKNIVHHRACVNSYQANRRLLKKGRSQ